MKRKMLVLSILMVLLISLITMAFASPPPAVTNFKAASGFNKVILAWSHSPGAEGYILYRKIGSENFKYRYITSRNGFIDHTAHFQYFNFYRVYPYKTVGGKRIVGPSDKYVYAISLNFSPVRNIRAVGEPGGVLLTWAPEYMLSEGYIIYRKVGSSGKFTYRALIKNPTTRFKDTTASISEFNFYRIYPYYTNNHGKFVVGPSERYVYAKALKPKN